MKRSTLFVAALMMCGSNVWATPSDMEFQQAKDALQADYDKLGLWFSEQLSDALAYNATSGTNLPANVAKLGGFEVGLTFGATASEIDTDALAHLGTAILATNQVDISSQLPIPVGVAHVKIGLPWGLDLGGKFGTYTISEDRDESDFSFKSKVWGVELRKSLSEDGITRPFGMAVGVSLDGNDGEVEYSEPYNTPTVYQGDTATPNVLNRITSDSAVRSFGAKVTVSKNLVFLTPFGGIGINKNFGKVTSTIHTAGTLTLTDNTGSNTQNIDIRSSQEDKAEDVDTRIFGGVEFNILLLKVGLSAEYAGQDIAGNIGLRFQFR